jgi:AraC family transcriptional regulator
LGAAWDSDVAHLGLINHDDFLTGPLGAWAALQIARQAPHAESDGGFSIEDLTALLLAEGARLRREASATAASASLSRAIAFIRDQPRHRYSLTDVARAAELHPTHLARAFKTRVGLTIGEYARRARVSWAQDALLRHPDWSLARVAAEAGFSDHAHFCRVFARVVGAPPSVMRNRLLETRLGTYDAKEGFERP